MFKEIETFISKKKRASVCVGGGRGGCVGGCCAGVGGRGGGAWRWGRWAG